MLPLPEGVERVAALATPGLAGSVEQAQVVPVSHEPLNPSDIASEALSAKEAIHSPGRRALRLSL